MTNTEVLQKSFEKAIKNGWNPGGIEGMLADIKSGWGLSGNETRGLIFSHDFAKAFWGDWEDLYQRQLELCIEDCIYRWQYHLQQMVLEENPIKYLERFL